MKIGAQVQNFEGRHSVTLKTDERVSTLEIPPRPTGFGSSANGGELLFLALATCYCNDLYREAAKKSIQVVRVEVDVSGEFGAPGEAGKNITYQVRVAAKASDEEIRELMALTDRMTEIQNTLRQGVEVKLTGEEVIR
jgi:organic hydroperoxide reductase OsmC/OhrA